MMSTRFSVGRAVADCTRHAANCSQLAIPFQLQTLTGQGLAGMQAQLAVGKAANLPTGANPCGHSLFRVNPVGENSPSYYVGEGTEVPSTLRGGLSGGRESVCRPDCGTSILALDLGTQTGWALLGRDGAITSGSELFKPQRFEGGGMRYLRFKRWVTEVKQAADGLNAVFFEEVRRHAGVDAAHAYGGFMAHLTAWCEHHQIPYQGVPVGTIKKHATGKGNANKDEMVAAARRLGHAPADDNEADALAILHWAIETQEV
jgi:Holliday junction resolvasome RuvABC endonuclease subunit